MLKGKGLLFNVGSLRKSSSGMDGTTCSRQSPQCMSITSPIIQSRPILLVTVPGRLSPSNELSVDISAATRDQKQVMTDSIELKRVITTTAMVRDLPRLKFLASFLNNTCT